MYALGRTVDYRDMPAVRKIVREAGERGLSFLGIGLAGGGERAVPHARSCGTAGARAQ